MKSYCLKCRKDTEDIDPKVSNTSDGKKNNIIKMCNVWKYKIKIYSRSRGKRTIKHFRC